VRGRLLPPRYRPIRVLARGATADVVLAHDTELARDVAVKILTARPAQDPTIPERFAREAVIAARLGRHPHVVTVYDTGRWRGRPFLVLELQPGGSLEDAIASGRVPRARALRWLRETAEAVDAAHALGVVHRDLKPANLLLDERDRIQVADFGIASLRGAADRITLTGTILGTAGYLSPEQARGERATEASDRYSLAVVACELLTGRRPPVRGAPARLEAVLERALAERPEDRFTTAAELVTAIEDALADAPAPTLAAAPAGRGDQTAVLRRHRATARARRVGRRLVTTVAAGLVAAVALLAFGYVRADAPAATTCTVSPPDHDANIVVTGIDAKAYCAKRAQNLKWTMRLGRKLRSPDLSEPLTVVCRSEDTDLRVTVYDNGRRQLGSRVCGQVTTGEQALGS
jgi:tRNA A-37 threonylcarbamoyl transferase component Bud32